MMENIQKVYLVLACNNYYPSSDNVKFVTTSEERAEKSAAKLRRKGKYDWVDISVKGLDK